MSYPDRPNGQTLSQACFNDLDIWHQDLENVQLLNRVTEILAQRTNQILPPPTSTSHELCFRRIQANYDAQALNQGDPNFGIFRPGLDEPNLTLTPSDQYQLQSQNNSHYHLQWDWDFQDQNNLRDTAIESYLIFPVENPATKDILTPFQIQVIRGGRRQGQRELYTRFHATEIHSPCYPNHDRRLFDNMTRQLNHMPISGDLRIRWTEKNLKKVGGMC